MTTTVQANEKGMSRRAIAEWLTFVIGIATVLSSLVVDLEKNYWGTTISGNEIRVVALSIGTSIIAASIVSILNRKVAPTAEKSDVEQLISWGVSHIYPSKDEITERCSYLIQSAHSMDVAGNTLRGFLKEHKKTITSRVRDGDLKVRILVHDPDSSASKEIARFHGYDDEMVAAKAVRRLSKWARELDANGSVKVLLAPHRISHSYQRIDGTVFYGPYLRDVESQKTFMMELDKSSGMGLVLDKAFEHQLELLGSASELSGTTGRTIVEFLGLPGAGKTTMAFEIFRRHPNVSYFSNELVASYDTDTPFDFNRRVIIKLKEFLESAPRDHLIVLDRGTEDYRAWLAVHKTSKTLDKKQLSILEKMVPSLSGEKVSRVIFRIDPAVSLQRRKVERHVDKFALTKNTLSVLQAEYRKATGHVVDATESLDSVRRSVFEHLGLR